jgi:mRNA-degrading endonuclease YafQ of YafQ-DinJ toxin-antitoxin module
MNLRYATTFTFRRHFKERISPDESLVEAYQASVDAFFQDPKLVDDHALEEPMHDRRAFWMNNDYRVVYRVKGDYLLFDDIGTHAQVYQR